MLTDDQSKTISIITTPSVIHQGNDICVPDVTFVLYQGTEEYAVTFKSPY